MLFFKKTYWQFLLKSTNEHGVHSPFVYALVTQCFYNKKFLRSESIISTVGFPSFIGKKQISILQAVFPYLKISRVFFLVNKEHAVNQLAVLKNAEVKKNTDAQAIYISSSFKVEELKRVFGELKNDGFLIIENPYSKLESWNALKDTLQNKVVVDTYYFALVFKKQQQAEETFYIRI